MPEIQKEKIKYKQLLVRIDEKNYTDIHKLSFLTGYSIAKLIRDMMETKLNEYRKILNNSDITIS